MASVLLSLIGLIVFFVCIIIFAPYLSIFAYGFGFLFGAFKLVFNMFAFTGASCSVISGVAGVIGSLLLGFLFIKIYQIFRGHSN